jgi:hypothetical protein
MSREEEFEKMFISEMRKKFQSLDSRRNLLYLMMEEIRLEQMQQRQRNVSRTEVVELFQEEFNDVATALRYMDAQEVLGDWIK